METDKTLGTEIPTRLMPNTTKFIECELCKAKKMDVTYRLKCEKHLCDECYEFLGFIADKSQSNKFDLQKYLKHSGVMGKYLKCSFDNFHGSEKLIKDLRSMTQKDLTSIYFHGINGCGKTHLAVAIMRELVKMGIFGRKRLRIVTIPELFLRIRRGFNNPYSEDEWSIVNDYSNVQHLVLDDLGAEKQSDYAVEILYVIIDRRDKLEKPTIITSNYDLDKLGNSVGTRITSRLSGYKVIKINREDYRKKR